jgi:hypothetical protein
MYSSMRRSCTRFFAVVASPARSCGIGILNLFFIFDLPSDITAVYVFPADIFGHFLDGNILPIRLSPIDGVKDMTLDAITLALKLGLMYCCCCGRLIFALVSTVFVRCGCCGRLIFALVSTVFVRCGRTPLAIFSALTSVSILV